MIHDKNETIDWYSLNKEELMKLLLPESVWVSSSTAVSLQARMARTCSENKQRAGSDIDELVRSFIEIAEEVRLALFARIDDLHSSFVERHRMFTSHLDSLMEGVYNSIHSNQKERALQGRKEPSDIDVAGRDIFNIEGRIEESRRLQRVLGEVRQKVDGPRLQKQADEFERIAEGRANYYDEERAEEVYRKVMGDVVESVQERWDVAGDARIVRDPFADVRVKKKEGDRQMSGEQLLEGILKVRKVEEARSDQVGKEEKSVVVNQNTGVLAERTKGLSLGGSLDKTVQTDHSGDITAICVLNKRYLCTCSLDNTIQVWDVISRGGTSVLKITGLKAPVHIIRKIVRNASHPLSHAILTCEASKSSENVCLYDLTSPSFEIPSLRFCSQSSQQVVCMEILNRNTAVLGYGTGDLILLDLGTMNLVSETNVGVRIDCLLILPDKESIVFACDNEIHVCRVDQAKKIVAISKKRDSVGVSYFRCLGKSSEVFCAIMTNGLARIYRTNDIECIHVVLGKRTVYDGSLILNFVSEIPRVYIISLSKIKPYFSYSDIDESNMKDVQFSENSLYTAAGGDHKIQVVHAEKTHVLIATISNVPFKSPAIWIWKLDFDSILAQKQDVDLRKS